MFGLIDYIRLIYHQRYFSKKQIEKYQFKQIKKIVKYARKHSPFYRAYYEGYPLNTIDDFYLFPTINKQIMMENFSSLNTSLLVKEEVEAYAIKKEIEKDYYGYYQDQFVVGLSSGTSGNRGIYITPKKMTKRLPFVFLARSGLRLRELPFRILFLLRVFSQGFDDINSPFIKLKYMSTMASPETIIKTINEMNINILMAPPSLLRQIIIFAGLIKVKIKKVVTYAEVLNKEDKHRFEEAFHSSVIEIYQASEGQMASACKDGTLHINEDLVFVELYNQKNELIQTKGEIGHKMIITNLVNFAQPLIRYEMNDMVVLKENCSCHSHFRAIDQVLGRHDDLLYFITSSGEERIVYPDLFVRWIIISSDLIKEFQVVQPKKNEINITLDLAVEDDSVITILNQILHNELAKLDCHQVVISYTLAKISLPQEKNKYKRFINTIKK
ncbi:MAG: F390 synthetase-related protein [Candidatus Izemoplasmatales bacterium]